MQKVTLIRAISAIAPLFFLVACSGASAPKEITGSGSTPPGQSTGGLCELSPPLSVPVDDLAASLICYSDISQATRPPVLLVQGTGLTAEENWSWNYIPALQLLGWPVCTVDLPDRALGDIQNSAEYIVYAIRTMAQQSQQKVQIVGCSQGGMSPRWAFKYWPDVRGLVEDHVGLAPSNHGTVVARAACAPDCEPANWQQRDDSEFIAALNDGFETVPEIDYTVVYTKLDEVVVPNNDENGSSSLRGGGANVMNIATQDVCPANTADHLALCSFDPIGFALAIDALENDGPADQTRLPGWSAIPGTAAVCAQTFMPGVNLRTFAQDFLTAGVGIGNGYGTSPHVPEEPELKCYAD